MLMDYPAFPRRVEAGIRLVSMLLDHIFMCFIIGCICTPVMLIGFMRMDANPQTDVFPFSGGLLYVFNIPFALYFCKDCIAGRSLAKRILKLQVLNNTTGAVASPFRCLVRNLFCILWPLEVIVTIANPPRRIGDLAAGTKVDYFDPVNIIQPKPNVLQILLAFLIAFGILARLSFGFEKLFHFG